MAETPRTLITDALVQLGAYEPGQTPQPEEMAYGFRVLNRILDAWKAQYNFFAFQRKQVRKTLSAGIQNYTLGPGGTFNMDRPEGRQPGKGILECSISVGTGSQERRYPVKIFTPDEWMAVPTPAFQGSIWPWAVVTDGAYPLMNLTFYQVPAANNDVIFLVGTPVQEFATLDDVFDLPPSWRSGVINNVAVQAAGGIRRDGKPLPIPAQVRIDADAAIRVLGQNDGDGFNTMAMLPRTGSGTNGAGPVAFAVFRAGGFW